MLAMWVALVLLVVLTAISLLRCSEAVTPMMAFAPPWILGLAAALANPVAGLSWDVTGALAMASIYLVFGEGLVRANPVEPPAVAGDRGASGDARGKAAPWYWALVGVAILGAALKLRASYEHLGGSPEAMFVLNALREAVTSGTLAFSSVATTLASSMYIAAALTGFLCRDRIRARYFTQLIPVAIDSAATSGRGSFLVVAMITLVGLAVAWRGPRRNVMVALGGAATAVIALVLGLSLVIGRSDVDETLWEYVVGPLFGLEAYLKAEPASGIHGPTLISALTAKLGGGAYEPGDFVWTAPFVANVTSGFREVLNDMGRAGLALFIVLGAVTMAAHRRFRLHGGWGPYAVAVSLYAYLGYFYYVSLGAFLPGWWVLLLSGVVAGIFGGSQLISNVTSSINLSFLHGRSAIRRVAAIALGCAVVGGVHGLLAPKWYRSVLTVVPSPRSSAASIMGSELGALAAGFDGQGDGAAGAARIAAVLQSTAVSDATIRKFDLRARYREMYQEDARDALWRHCAVNILTKPNLVQLSCEGKDPRFVHEMLSYMGEIGSQVFRRVSVSSATEEVRFVEKRVAELRSRADEATARMREFQEKHHIVDLEGQAREVVSSLATLNSQRIWKQLEIEYARRFSSSDEARVRQLEAQLSVVDDKLRDLQEPRPVPPAPPVERPRRRDKDAGGGMFPAALEVPRVRAEYEKLYRQRRVGEMTLVFALERLEAARANEARDVSTFQVLDPPSLATRPARPRPLQGVPVAAVAGLVGAVLLEWLRHACRARPLDSSLPLTKGA